MKFVVTVQLGEDYFDSVLVVESNAYNAIYEAILKLDCTYADVISVVRIGDKV